MNSSPPAAAEAELLAKKVHSDLRQTPVSKTTSFSVNHQKNCLLEKALNIKIPVIIYDSVRIGQKRSKRPSHVEDTSSIPAGSAKN